MEKAIGHIMEFIMIIVIGMILLHVFLLEVRWLYPESQFGIEQSGGIINIIK